jgi:hypothetical protein
MLDCYLENVEQTDCKKIYRAKTPSTQKKYLAQSAVFPISSRNLILRRSRYCNEIKYFFGEDGKGEVPPFLPLRCAGGAAAL